MTTVEQILSAADEIQRKTRGGKANFIYAPEDATFVSEGT